MYHQQSVLQINTFEFILPLILGLKRACFSFALLNHFVVSSTLFEYYTLIKVYLSPERETENFFRHGKIRQLENQCHFFWFDYLYWGNERDLIS